VVQINIKGAQVKPAKHVVDDSAYRAAVDRHADNQSFLKMVGSVASFMDSVEKEGVEKDRQKAAGKVSVWEGTEQEDLTADAYKKGEEAAPTTDNPTFSQQVGITPMDVDRQSSPYSTYKAMESMNLGSLDEIGETGNAPFDQALKDLRVIERHKHQEAFKAGHDAKLLRSTFENAPQDAPLPKRLEGAVGNFDKVKGHLLDEDASTDSFEEVFAEVLLGEMDNETLGDLLRYDGDYVADLIAVGRRGGLNAVALGAIQRKSGRVIAKEVEADPASMAWQIVVENPEKGDSLRSHALPHLSPEGRARLDRKVESFRIIEKRLKKTGHPRNPETYGEIVGGLRVEDVHDYFAHNNDRQLENGFQDEDLTRLLTMPEFGGGPEGGGMLYRIPVSGAISPMEQDVLPEGYLLYYGPGESVGGGGGGGGGGGYRAGSGGRRGGVRPPEVHDALTETTKDRPNRELATRIAEKYFVEHHGMNPGSLTDEKTIKISHESGDPEALVNMIMTKYPGSPLGMGQGFSVKTMNRQMDWLVGEGLMITHDPNTGFLHATWDMDNLNSLTPDDLDTLGISEIRYPGDHANRQWYQFIPKDPGAKPIIQGSSQWQKIRADGIAMVGNFHPTKQDLQANLKVDLGKLKTDSENYGEHGIEAFSKWSTELLVFEWQKRWIADLMGVDINHPDAQDMVRNAGAAGNMVATVAAAGIYRRVLNGMVTSRFRITGTTPTQRLASVSRARGALTVAQLDDFLVRVLKATPEQMARVASNAADQVADQSLRPAQRGAATALANSQQKWNLVRELGGKDKATMKTLDKFLRKEVSPLKGSGTTLKEIAKDAAKWTGRNLKNLPKFLLTKFGPQALAWWLIETAIEEGTDSYFRVKGLHSVTGLSLMKRFDQNRDGVIDAKEREGIPEGFHDRFSAAEARDEDGKLVRDEDGNAIITREGLEEQFGKGGRDETTKELIRRRWGDDANVESPYTNLFNEDNTALDYWKYGALMVPDVALEFMSLGQLSLQEVRAIWGGLAAKAEQSNDQVAQERQLLRNNIVGDVHTFQRNLTLSVGLNPEVGLVAANDLAHNFVNATQIMTPPPGTATELTSYNDELELNLLRIPESYNGQPLRSGVEAFLQGSITPGRTMVSDEEYDALVQEMMDASKGYPPGSRNWWSPSDVSPAEATEWLNKLGAAEGASAVNVQHMLSEEGMRTGSAADFVETLDLTRGGPLEPYLHEYARYAALLKTPAGRGEYQGADPKTIPGLAAHSSPEELESQPIDGMGYLAWVADGCPIVGSDGSLMRSRSIKVSDALGLDVSSDYMGLASVNLGKIDGTISFTSYLTGDVPPFLKYLDLERVTPSNPAEMKAAYNDFLELADMVAYGQGREGITKAQGLWDQVVGTQQEAVRALATGYERWGRIRKARYDAKEGMLYTQENMERLDEMTALPGASSGRQWKETIQADALMQLDGVTPGGLDWPAGRYSDTRPGAIWDFSEAESPIEVEEQIVKDIEYLNEKITMELGRAPTAMTTASGQASATSRAKRVARMEEAIKVLRNLRYRTRLVNDSQARQRESRTGMPSLFSDNTLRWEAWHTIPQDPTRKLTPETDRRRRE